MIFYYGWMEEWNSNYKRAVNLNLIGCNVIIYTILWVFGI